MAKIDALVQQVVPDLLDPREHAQSGDILRGSIAAQKLARLHELVLSCQDSATFELRCRLDEHGRCLVNVQCRVRVELTCQRCLEPLSLVLEQCSTLVALNDALEADRMPREFEPVLCDAHGLIDLPAMIEDELILALPMVARHEYPCTAVSTTAGEVQRKNPFAVLGRLLDRDH